MTVSLQRRTAQQTLYRLRPGVHYAPVDRGVFFGTSKGRFVMNGPAILFRVVDVIVPVLEQGSDLDGLVGAVGTEKARPIVEAVWELFEQRGLLLPADPHVERDRAQGIGQDALAYLEREAPHPAASYRAVRNGRVLLKGPWSVLASAARGLVRSGVGEIVLDLDPGEETASAALRAHNQTVQLLHESNADADVSIMIGSANRYEPAINTGRVIPVVVSDKVAVVGSVGGPERWQQCRELAERGAFWAEETTALPRPVGDAMVGALAGHEAFLALAGLTGEHPMAHVVHGPDLSADVVDLPATGMPVPAGSFASSISLHSATGPIPTIDTEAALAVTEQIGAQWRGTMRLSAHPDIPQLPLSIATAQPWRSPATLLARWGGNHVSATIEAALAGLRRSVSPVETEVGAAGLDTQRWLLDGFLRWAAPRVEFVQEIDFADAPTGQVMRLWRTVEDFEFVSIRVAVGSMPGVPWMLARVTDDADGSPLAWGWGQNLPHALLAVLGTVLARIQVRRAVGHDLVGGEVDTAALADAPVDEVMRLRDAVAANWQVIGRPVPLGSLDGSSGDNGFIAGAVSVHD